VPINGHENGDQRDGKEQHEAGDGIQGKHENEDGQGHQRCQGQLRQVLAEIGVQGLDALDHGISQFSAALTFRARRAVG
jgi:hypothetical protein